MADDDSLEKALYEMKGVIALLQANLFNMVKVKDVKEAEALLIQIEKAVDKFVDRSREELGRLAPSREQQDLLEEGKIPENIDQEAKEALKMAIELKRQVEEMQNIAYREQGNFDAEVEKEEPPSKTKLTKQQHKKRFKRLGGDNWKPL